MLEEDYCMYVKQFDKSYVMFFLYVVDMSLARNYKRMVDDTKDIEL